MNTRIFALVVLLSALPMLGQKKEEKPKVHSDFQFGSLPTSRDFIQLMSSEQARLIVVGDAEGWDNEKISKNFKFTVKDLNVISDKLEDERLVRRDDDNYRISPGMPVIRERDWLRVKDGLQRHVQGFYTLIQSHWAEIEAMVTSLDGSKSLPKERLMYETVVSGILMGGMIDAFYDDKTLLPPGPRRGKNGTNRYYAWLAENPEAVGKLKRDLRESDNYRIISIGPELPEDRQDVSDLRGKATVYGDADAVKYRRFIAVFSRDMLLPYFKSHRAEFLDPGKMMSSGSYVTAAEIFGWYYNAMVNGVVDGLVAAKRIAPPEKYYTYAVKIPQ